MHSLFIYTTTFMKTLKKGFRLLFLFLLIILASFGIGIAGAIPVLPKSKRNETEIQTEFFEKRKDLKEIIERNEKE